jgi:type II secretory pathway component GspD/PulD (secretin)
LATREAAPAALLQQKVTATFDRIPLADALQELAELSGVSVLVDERAAKMAQSPVKATLNNDVSLETAMRLLADMADLKAVRVGGALYVTSKENAKALEAEEKKIRKAEKREDKRKKTKKEEKSKTESPK